MRGEPAHQLERRRRARGGERRAARAGGSRGRCGRWARSAPASRRDRRGPRRDELERGGALLGDTDDAHRRLHAGERLVRDGAALVEDEPRRDAAARAARSTASGAAVPQTSSSQPNESHTSWAGVKSGLEQGARRPRRCRPAQPLSSRVPRPQIARRRSSAPNGGCCHGASSSTGTTSRCAISTTGRSALAPAPVEEQAVGVRPG